MELGRLLLYGGSGVAALALIGGAISAIVFRHKEKKLKKQLDAEYGSGR